MLILDLGEVPPDSEALFGGKACGLARLIAAGARVPPGFALQASASGADGWTPPEDDEFRRRVAAMTPSGPLAVRSSAVGEDGAEHSFAGMFETQLDVLDADEALSAAARCVASGRSSRVLAYTNGETPPAIGVVVQSQVRARAAGVCFTVDPAGRDGAVLIEAVAGGGHQLVSGHVQPQRWCVYRSGLGQWEVRQDGGANGAQVLEDSDLTRIAEEGTRYADKLGHPLDLEWAVDGEGELWWLQARPVTAASPPPRFEVNRASDEVDDGPVTVWSNWNVRETMPDPFMPLTWSIWRDTIIPTLISRVFGTPPSSPLFKHLQCLDLVHGRIYFNMNGVIAWPIVGSLLIRRLLKLVDPEAADVCSKLSSVGVLRPRRLPASRVRLMANVMRAGLGDARRYAAALRPRRSMAALKEFEVTMARRERDRPLPSLSDQALLDEMRFFGSPDFPLPEHAMHCEILAIAVYHQAMRAFRDHPQASNMLAVGIPENPTTQISIAIDALVDSAQPLAAPFRQCLSVDELITRLQVEPDGQVWLEELSNFMRRFGHRGPKEFDLGASRWCEAPEMIIELVRMGLESPKAERVADRLERLANQRRQVLESAVTASAWWRRPALRWLSRLVEIYMPLREAPKHYAMLAFQRMRAASLELGARLTQRGRIDERDDVFFVELPELEQVGGGANFDLHPRVAERRARFERFRAQRAPNYYRSDGVPVEVARPEPDGRQNGALHATGVSAGCASGPVRILTEPDPRLMADGDVIVVEFADPGWTPLFPRAAAVVMEVGGLMCHAAVVARELGIPAVFSAANATHILHDGQSVTVDGERGTVTPN